MQISRTLFTIFLTFFNIHFEAKNTLLNPNRKEAKNKQFSTVKKTPKNTNHKNKQFWTTKKTPNITNRKNRQILTYERHVKIT